MNIIPTKQLPNSHPLPHSAQIETQNGTINSLVDEAQSRTTELAAVQASFNASFQETSQRAEREMEHSSRELASARLEIQTLAEQLSNVNHEMAECKVTVRELEDRIRLQESEIAALVNRIKVEQATLVSSCNEAAHLASLAVANHGQQLRSLADQNRSEIEMFMMKKTRESDRSLHKLEKQQQEQLVALQVAVGERDMLVSTMQTERDQLRGALAQCAQSLAVAVAESDCIRGICSFVGPAGVGAFVHEDETGRHFIFTDITPDGPAARVRREKRVCAFGGKGCVVMMMGGRKERSSSRC